MKMNKKAFTLVEILFVVVIALMALGFSAYKLKEMKSRGVGYGATGFLVDLGGAKAAITADLAREGIDLDFELRQPSSGITENIEVTTEGIEIDPHEAEGKTIGQYLRENHFSKDALIKALSIFGYLKYGIDSVGEYRYYLYAGFPISNQCGSLPPKLNEHTITYMCGVSHRNVHPAVVDDTRCKITKGAVFLDDGKISSSGNQRPTVIGPNICDLKNLGKGNVPKLFRCSARQDKKEFSGYLANCPSTASFYNSGVDSLLLQGTAPAYENCSNPQNPNCKTICSYDTTEANNVASDDFGKNHYITVIDPEDETQQRQISMTCYDYWHHYGTITYE